ncbi:MULTISPECIES: hypothetical protein [Cupriavidus]|uniref:hypothetical protein n=1 Tax=Cupriavidus sp. DF5525 TaxID=3160989 RepID=UPI00042874E9
MIPVSVGVKSGQTLQGCHPLWDRQCIARNFQAIVHNTDLILTVCIVMLKSKAEICLSLPMVVNCGGAQPRVYREFHQLF